ncbi:sulfite exporter TauE/SafE family protein [Flavobacteriales bacterium]|nr:sulfite exporter TauE/SafE family protein [Flavobacteriales bacterium]
MIVLGYFLALFVGILLGLIGGGGSILTVPILVYIMGVSPVSATAYSLFIVGISALVGAHRFFKNGHVNFRISLFFGIPSLIGVFLCRKWIVPSLPESFSFFHILTINKDSFILIVFALVMLIASFPMLFSWKMPERKQNNKPFLIAVDGILVGIITGFVGAGGGFLIIPALLLLTNISMKEAVGTSLLIIAIKSILGFTAELGNPIDWNLLMLFTASSILGIFIGTYFSNIINGSILKKSFGIFVFVMAIIIFLKEIVFI